MNRKTKSALLTGILLSISSMQANAWGDYDRDYDRGDYYQGEYDNSWTHNHYEGCGHKTYSVPEPSTLALMSLGILGIAFTRNIKKK